VRLERRRELAMRLFSSRIAKLETMNRILTDAARKRTERIEELETQATQLERQVALLINEKNNELAAVREERIKRADVINEKNKELAAVREELIKCAGQG
jgi:predicted metal-dependent phosphoesterase TrpH